MFSFFLSAGFLPSTLNMCIPYGKYANDSAACAKLEPMHANNACAIANVWQLHQKATSKGTAKYRQVMPHLHHHKHTTVEPEVV